MTSSLLNVRKNIMTETDFMHVTNMTQEQFLSLVYNKLNIKDTIELRRSLQHAMTGYRRTHPATDPRIWKATTMWMKLERVARKAFIYHKMKELFRHFPSWSRTTRKIEAKRQWEKFIKQNSY